MSRFERRNYFESLVTMRLAYEVLDEADRTAVITIDEVIAWAVRELEATHASRTQAEDGALSGQPQSEGGASENSVSCRPAGPSSRALSVPHGVRVGLGEDRRAGIGQRRRHQGGVTDLERRP